MIFNMTGLGGKNGEDSIPVQGTDFTWSGAAGTIRVIYDLEGDWRIKFLGSGTFKPLKAMTIDAFLVGGGGAGGSTGNRKKKASGGGGGYTTTLRNVALTANTEYPIVVGEGGTATLYSIAFGNDGGATTAFGGTAAGGKGGGNGGATNIAIGEMYAPCAGCGGSGGGTIESLGGTDGADGGGANSLTDEDTGVVTWYGKGQGSTTREFGETTGDLYASGGDGGVDLNTSLPGLPNTGNGGTGTIAWFDDGRVGGSGIVVIRNVRG